MSKNLMEYTKDQLINIGDQLMIPKNEMSQAKKSTLISKIEDKAEELSVNIPEPENIVEVKQPVQTSGEKQAPKRIKDYPRKKIVLEARDAAVKQQPVGINEYTALIQIGEEVLVPEPVVTLLEGLTDTVHVKNSEGNVEAKRVSRFYVKYVK